MNKSIALAQIAMALSWARTNLSAIDREQFSEEVTALLDQLDAQTLLDNMSLVERKESVA